MDLTDLQWQAIQHLLPPVHQGRGRPAFDSRLVLNGIFWKIRTNSPWRELPLRFPSHQTCFRFYEKWQSSGLFSSLVLHLYSDLVYRGNFTPHQAFTEKRIILLAGKRSFEFFLAPRYLDDWRTHTCLLFIQVELLTLKKRGFTGFAGSSRLRARLPEIAFIFSNWPKFAPLGFDQTGNRMVDGREDIIFKVRSS
jgi:hypothetical protein